MISRRRLLALVAGASALNACSDPSETAGDAIEIRYGDDRSQVGDLYLPAGDGKVPAVVVIHGGFWMSGYGKELATPLAEDLAKHGVAGYAIEYRRLGNGGGWTATFEDVAAAVDALADQPRVLVDQVVAVGHSAGGHLAVWPPAAQLSHPVRRAPGRASYSRGAVEGAGRAGPWDTRRPGAARPEPPLLGRRAARRWRGDAHRTGRRALRADRSDRRHGSPAGRKPCDYWADSSTGRTEAIADAVG